MYEKNEEKLKEMKEKYPKVLERLILDDDDLEDYIEKQYPDEYSKYNENEYDDIDEFVQENDGIELRMPMELFGISCGSGWYSIIDALCKTIRGYCTDINEDEEYRIPRAVQIKEKFGGLRFYVDGIPEEISEKINGAKRMAEMMSFTTCENCGATVNVSRDESGWIKTLCEECREERKSDKEKALEIIKTDEEYRPPGPSN